MDHDSFDEHLLYPHGQSWMDPQGGPAASLHDVVVGPVFDQWIDGISTLAEGMDRRTVAAYLISIFAWKLGLIIGERYLTGALPLLNARSLFASLQIRGEGRTRVAHFRYGLSDTSAPLVSDPDGLRQTMIAIYEPLVEALHRRTGLSSNALWRLVTDEVAAGLLAYGKRTGCVERAQREATATVAQSPLYNRQWHYENITIENGRSEWFRLRGGCCRIYRIGKNALCPSCVVRPEHDRVRALQDVVRRRPERS